MDWNWTAIEAISSVVAGIFVFISIIFLVFEIRHNAKAIEGATVLSLMSLEREVFTLLAANADLFIRGSEEISKLSPVERFKFDRIVSCEMSLIYSGYVQYQQGLMDLEVWDAYLNSIQRYAIQPGFLESWNGFKSGYPKSFRDLIDVTVVATV